MIKEFNHKMNYNVLVNSSNIADIRIKKYYCMWISNIILNYNLTKVVFIYKYVIVL